MVLTPPSTFNRPLLRVGHLAPLDFVDCLLLLFLTVLAIQLYTRCLRSLGRRIRSHAHVRTKTSTLISRMVSVVKQPFLGYFAAVSVPQPPESTVAKIEQAKALVAHDEVKPCRQTYDAFLVLDVEATCCQGSDFSYPNEIIVCILRQ
jgi:hypothetical protein